jgi:hypothetical protein
MMPQASARVENSGLLPTQYLGLVIAASALSAVIIHAAQQNRGLFDPLVTVVMSASNRNWRRGSGMGAIRCVQPWG